jgi:UDP-N-acetylmuramoyl-L-alanyl-D-glutamate--2,6-diaminopimelate ligase
VTTDNPRFENIDSIFQDIARGFNFSKNIFFIHDREEAITLAIEQSTKDTIIALIGKGDETYQDINAVKSIHSQKKKSYISTF